MQRITSGGGDGTGQGISRPSSVFESSDDDDDSSTSSSTDEPGNFGELIEEEYDDGEPKSVSVGGFTAPTLTGSSDTGSSDTGSSDTGSSDTDEPRNDFSDEVAELQDALAERDEAIEGLSDEFGNAVGQLAGQQQEMMGLFGQIMGQEDEEGGGSGGLSMTLILAGGAALVGLFALSQEG